MKFGLQSIGGTFIYEASSKGVLYITQDSKTHIDIHTHTQSQIQYNQKIQTTNTLTNTQTHMK